MIDLPKPVKLAWGIRRERRSLWSRNAVKGISVRGERRKRDGRNEWRLWDPNRSKVAASVLKTKRDASALLPEVASISVLPRLISLLFSASSKIYFAILSLTDPVGFINSHLSHTV